LVNVSTEDGFKTAPLITPPMIPPTKPNAPAMAPEIPPFFMLSPELMGLSITPAKYPATNPRNNPRHVAQRGWIRVLPWTSTKVTEPTIKPDLTMNYLLFLAHTIFETDQLNYSRYAFIYGIYIKYIHPVIKLTPDLQFNDNKQLHKWYQSKKSSFTILKTFHILV
jgi:hypothetical protein